MWLLLDVWVMFVNKFIFIIQWYVLKFTVFEITNSYLGMQNTS